MNVVLITVLAAVCLSTCNGQSYSDYNYEPDFLDMDPDSILEENARITTNATCGGRRREYYCRLVEHADGALMYRQHSRVRRQVMTHQQQKRQPQSYRDPSGQWVQCNYCDEHDPQLRHPIEYVIRGDERLWWQSPSLAEGLNFHAVTITMDFTQVYQIVYVLLRMGDSPRPANWILERSLDKVVYKPWVFFAESEYDCKRLYQPLIQSKLTITSGPRPWKLADDEVYCTTFYSKPESLQSGEIIITLSLDRESTSTSPHMMDRAISPKLIEFLSARYVRLRFQKLQTLSGDWMAMPNQLDSSVYNRYYYSIRTIKVGGKCLCNSHANRCEQSVINGVPRAICVCQHNSCGTNCETCCPMFNQQPWRPGRICEECNCHGKADKCVFNQTVANLRLSQLRDGVYEGGGVCVDCKQETTGINCESCKRGFFRPDYVTPNSQFPCKKCDCDSSGSSGDCVSDNKEAPLRTPGDCICKKGFTGKRCDQCAEGYKRSLNNPSKCEPCICDVRGSHRAGGYRCEPPCNCKVNVHQDSHCQTCQPGHFNLDVDNPEGCQACYCSQLTNQCVGVGPTTAMTLERNGLLGTVSNLHDWKIINPSASAESGYPVALPRLLSMVDELPPLVADIRTVEAWLSSASMHPIERGYYWSAPPAYLGKQITAYGQQLSIIIRFNSPTMMSYFGGTSDGRQFAPNSLAVRDRLDAMWSNEPAVVLEGKGYRLAYMIPPIHRDSHMIINIRMHESSFRVLVEPPTPVSMDRIPIELSQGSNVYANGRGKYQQAGRPATIGDLVTVLSRVDRILIKAKYIIDQTSIELRQVSLKRNIMDTDGQIPNMEECSCPTGHTGTSCESCAFGYWRDPKAADQSGGADLKGGMWRNTRRDTKPIRCVPCECNGHSGHCDEQTGKCIDCLHNTAGDKCDKCTLGFYGDPLTRSPAACQPCECPTLTNQKSNLCMANKQTLNTELKPYICLDCDENTRGRYCEICAPGYYGDPTNGIACKKCDCGRGAIGCNSTTGECTCGFNTAKPRCDTCAEGTHGEPTLGQACRPCNCHEMGSISVTCRAGDGQCTCAPGYEGKRCERCTAGRGNVDAGCPLCSCSPVGTIPGAQSTCDPVTGQCRCKPGVGGTLDCSYCSSGFFNLGTNGCEKCKCTKRAVDVSCDKYTGFCNCGQNVLGGTCDKCESGHFWNGTGPDCLPCDCGMGAKVNPTTGMIDDCNMLSGQCSCAPHVTGRQCTECVPGYFGLSQNGCEQCPSCPNGQKCDKETGKCICPPNTEGDQCDKCSVGSWNYNPIAGCKSCNCSDTGTEIGDNDTCDLISGQCRCRPGFTGRDCTSCDIGYYGYPDCRPCDCDARGTMRKNSTIDSSTICDQSTGKCYCKRNVQGDRCDECKPGTFGLNMDYAFGCYSCFCFTTESPATCSQLEGYRSVPDRENAFSIVSTDRDIMPGGALIKLEVGMSEEERADLSSVGNHFDWRFSTHRPTFLEIPELKGSLTRRYGTVALDIQSNCLPTGSCNLNPPDPTNPWEYMLADAAATNAVSKSTKVATLWIIRDPYRVDATMNVMNGTLLFEYQPPDNVPITLVDGFRSIWLRESDWVLTHAAGVDTRVRPTRNEFMLALMNITSFTVRLFMPEAKPKLVSVKYHVYQALSETATAAGTQITSIESCDCPETSYGDHCEIASDGFYFPPIVPKPGQSILPPKPGLPQLESPQNIVWKGGVEKCNCNGMSSHCHPNTGVCLSCTGNTMGPDCGKCAEGYMGDPKKGQTCVKCQCPTDQTDYAITCFPDRSSVSHRCVCKPGYQGQRCEQCSPKYFGDPRSMISCLPCDCDMAGSKREYCAKDTGQCDCWPGIFGRRCDQCQADHVVDRRKCRDCRGECTGELLVKADNVKATMDKINITSLAYRGLERLEKQVKELEKRFGPEMVEKEQLLVQRTQKIAEDIANLNDKVDRANGTKAELEQSHCKTQKIIADMLEDSQQMKKKAKDWIEEVSDLPKSLPDPIMIKQWQIFARHVRAEFNLINLNKTELWLTELTSKLVHLIGETESLTKSVKPSRSLVDFERLIAYQEQQKLILDGFTKQLQEVRNSTQNRQQELKEAKEDSETLRKAVENATSPEGIKQFEHNASKLRLKLDRQRELFKDEEDVLKRLETAKTALENVTSMNSSTLDKIHIPSNLESRYVVPLEQKADRIVLTLRLNKNLNRTVEAVEAYNTIVTNMEKAEKAITDAEHALDNSMSGVALQQLKTEVEENRMNVNATISLANMTINEDKEILNKNIIDSLDISGRKLDEIKHTMDGTLKEAANVVNQAELVAQEIEKTRPEVDNVDEQTTKRNTELMNLKKRLEAVEGKYSEMQGTAKTSVDQANNTQNNLIKLVEKTESNVQKLDSKLLNLRSLADEARAMLDVNYGALAKDPVPLVLGQKKCVYSLVPYAVTKSRVFDIEFWFRLHADTPKMGSVLMVGRRAFTGRTQMFAFTLESENTVLKFSWNMDGGDLEVDKIRTGIWYQVRVTSMWRKTRLMLTERPDHGNAQPIIREKDADPYNPEASLILDSQMEMRFGGPLQTESLLTDPASWGDNGAEELWSRLSSMEGAQFCLFNLRVGGVHMSLVDLATASTGCTNPSKLTCQLSLNYRRLLRNGYPWEVQGPLNNLSQTLRPSQKKPPNQILQRLFYYDFAGTGGYARIEELKDLNFCEDQIQFHLTPLTEAQRQKLMVFTYFNYDQDYGITVELFKGKPIATRWTGGQLYRTSPTNSNNAFHRRLLRRRIRWKRRFGRDILTSYKNKEEKRRISVTESEIAIKLWRLDERLATNCQDRAILYVGAIPPGHYSLRRRMKQLDLSITPFAGRIDLTNERGGQDGSYFLEEYLNAPSHSFGDTHFTDIQQRGEAVLLPSTNPSSQYCLHMSGVRMNGFIEVKKEAVDQISPYEPGISMTVLFNPMVTPTNEVGLLRIQMKISALWLIIALTPDYRVSILVPGAGEKLLTKEALTNKPLNDLAYDLTELEMKEAKIFNNSLPAWEKDRPLSSDSSPIDQTTGYMEVVVSLHFGSASSETLDVLFDQRIVQSWPIPNQENGKNIAQVLIGSFGFQDNYPITINHLLIGKHLVDFAKNLSVPEAETGILVGVCGGRRLHPRFLQRTGAVGPTWVMQGLDMSPPPGGRRVRFVEMQYGNGTDYNEPPSIESPGDSLRLPRQKLIVSSHAIIHGDEDCTENPKTSAWFDRSKNSYWMLNIASNDKPFEAVIGFRAQLTQSNTNLAPTTYSMLASFRLHQDNGNLNLLLNTSRLIVADEKKVLWVSPLVTMMDANWHRLKMVIPKNSVNAAVFSIELDGRRFDLPKSISKAVPLVALIGGLFNSGSMTIKHDREQVLVQGLFGCVDEIKFNGVDKDFTKSERPPCHECFSLDPNVIHVPVSIRDYLKLMRIPLTIPKVYLKDHVESLIFEFSFFHNRTESKTASIFVLKFTRRNSDSKYRLWLYVDNTALKMAYMEDGKRLEDADEPVQLSRMSSSQNVWHTINLDIRMSFESFLFRLRSQRETTAFQMPKFEMDRLESIVFGYDNVLTPEVMKQKFYGSPGVPFTGCIKDVSLRTPFSKSYLTFPSTITGLRKGVCPTG